MAHFCPDCGQQCYCDGEEVEVWLEYIDDCTHLCPDPEEDEEHEEKVVH